MSHNMHTLKYCAVTATIPDPHSSESSVPLSPMTVHGPTSRPANVMFTSAVPAGPVLPAAASGPAAMVMVERALPGWLETETWGRGRHGQPC